MLFFFFFFSSRRRHTRCSRDWSSDVCSSDLELARPGRRGRRRGRLGTCLDRRAGRDALATGGRAGKEWREIGRASCRGSVDLGGRRIIKKKKKEKEKVMAIVGEDHEVRY